MAGTRGLIDECETAVNAFPKANPKDTTLRLVRIA